MHHSLLLQLCCLGPYPPHRLQGSGDIFPLPAHPIPSRDEPSSEARGLLKQKGNSPVRLPPLTARHLGSLGSQLNSELLHRDLEPLILGNSERGRSAALPLGPGLAVSGDGMCCPGSSSTGGAGEGQPEQELACVQAQPEVQLHEPLCRAEALSTSHLAAARMPVPISAGGRSWPRSQVVPQLQACPKLLPAQGQDLQRKHSRVHRG